MQKLWKVWLYHATIKKNPALSEKSSSLHLFSPFSHCNPFDAFPEQVSIVVCFSDALETKRSIIQSTVYVLTTWICCTKSAQKALYWPNLPSTSNHTSSCIRLAARKHSVHSVSAKCIITIEAKSIEKIGSTTNKMHRMPFPLLLAVKNSFTTVVTNTSNHFSWHLFLFFISLHLARPLNDILALFDSFAAIVLACSMVYIHAMLLCSILTNVSLVPKERCAVYCTWISMLLIIRTRFKWIEDK